MAFSSFIKEFRSFYLRISAPMNDMNKKEKEILCNCPINEREATYLVVQRHFEKPFSQTPGTDFFYKPSPYSL